MAVLLTRIQGKLCDKEDYMQSSADKVNQWLAAQGPKTFFIIFLGIPQKNLKKMLLAPVVGSSRV